eukprot:768064-Hanusia_phi.AAC.1
MKVICWQSRRGGAGEGGGGGRGWRQGLEGREPVPCAGACDWQVKGYERSAEGHWRVRGEETGEEMSSGCTGGGERRGDYRRTGECLSGGEEEAQQERRRKHSRRGGGSTAGEEEEAQQERRRKHSRRGGGSPAVGVCEAGGGQPARA